MRNLYTVRTLRALIGLACALAVFGGLFVGLPVRSLAQGSIEAIVTADQLNMRSAPNTRGTILTTLNLGQRITITGRNENVGWGYGTADNGALGWFVLQYVEVQGQVNVRDLPVLDASAPTAAPGGAPAAPPAGGGAAPGAPTQPPAAPPPPAASGNIRGGFELGGQVNALSAVTINAMRVGGLTWIKRQAFAGDGAGFAFINEAKANGFRILLSVIGDKEAVVTSAYHDVYAGYVAQLAAAGADAIEVWNEQNIDREWKRGSIDPVIYTQLLAKAYNAIKGANPNTLVISGAPAPTGAEGAFGLDRVWNDDRYLAGMAAAGAGRYADCIGIHYNEGIVSPRLRSGDPRGDNYPTRYYDTMVQRALGPFGGKRGCFTEIGYLSPEGYGPLPGGFAWAGNTTVAQQATWLAEAAVRASNSGRIRLFIIFNVDFTLFGGEDPQGGYAMIRPGGACPACEALAAVR
jgi:uncharacterized protein YraI